MMICPLSYVKSWRPGKTAAAACIKNECAWWDDSRQCCAAKRPAPEQKETDGVHTAEEAAKWFFHRAAALREDTPEARACEFALAALNEQIRKKRGCEYCTAIESTNRAGRKFFIPIPVHKSTSHSVGEICLTYGADGWFIHYEDASDIWCDIPTTHCPACGRRLEAK